MKSQRYIAQCLFSLILVVSVLMSGFVPSGYSRSRHLVSSLAAPHSPAALNGGESWQSVNTGLGSLNIAALAIDPVNTATIYAGTGGGMFKSIDGGATWSKVGIDAGSVAALAINFVNPNIIHAGTADGGWCRSTFPLFKSTDGGASWSNANSPADCGGMSLLVMDPTSPNTLYAGSFGQYISSGSIILWKSTDGGATWNNRWFGNPGIASYGLVIDPANPETLYAPGDLYGNMNIIDSGLFKSTDGGANWTATGLTNTTIAAVAIDPLNPHTLYAGSADWGAPQAPFRSMFKSTDSGANWLAINNGLTNISRITTIVVDRDNPSILYIGTSSGVFRSTDGGANWSAFNDGLTNLDIRVLTLAPGNPNTLYAGTSGGVFKITENTPATNPIDEAQFFVRQHYLDFLSREPEPSGLDAWLSVLNRCPDLLNDPTCDRITVSASFFGSPEFQLKGFYVFRFYRAAFDRLPEYGEVAADMQGVTGQTPAEVYQRKAAFADAFVQRQEFVNRFAALSHADYVAALLNRYQLESITAPAPTNPDDTAKVTLTRADLIAALDAGTLTRAQVLRAVADSDEVLAAEFNRAFVAMQYYGYLRRTPEEAGYNAWLNYLHAHPQDFRTMVHGFVNSIEYRARFGRP